MERHIWSGAQCWPLGLSWPAARPPASPCHDRVTGVGGESKWSSPLRGQPSTGPVLWLSVCPPLTPRAETTVPYRWAGGRSDTWGPGSARRGGRQGAAWGQGRRSVWVQMLLENPSSLLRTLRGKQLVLGAVVREWGCRQGLRLPNPRTLPRMAKRSGSSTCYWREGVDLLGGRLTRLSTCSCAQS